MSLPPQKHIALSAILLAAFCGAGAAEAQYSRIKTPVPETVSTIPNARAIESVDFGFHQTAAALIWLKINQGVYTWLSNTQKYERFSKEIETLTTLDPKWGFPYAFGILLLPSFDKTEQAIKLGERGMINAKNDWRIPYYLAIVYHANIKDRVSAGKYFLLAAQTKDAPEDVKQMPTLYAERKSSIEEMEKIWEVLYKNADNETIREEAWQQLLYLQALKEQAGEAGNTKN